MAVQYDALTDIETERLIEPKNILSLCVTLLPGGGGAPEHYSFCNHDGYDGSIRDGVTLLLGARALIGHNIIVFNSKHINRIMGVTLDKAKMVDTLSACRILWPDIRDQDIADAKIRSPVYGKHSLAAWGHRLAVHKGDFSAWGTWSPEMQSYCEQDVRTTYALYQHILEATADMKVPA